MSESGSFFFESFSYNRITLNIFFIHIILTRLSLPTVSNSEDPVSFFSVQKGFIVFHSC